MPDDLSLVAGVGGGEQLQTAYVALLRRGAPWGEHGDIEGQHGGFAGSQGRASVSHHHGPAQVAGETELALVATGGNAQSPHELPVVERDIRDQKRRVVERVKSRALGLRQIFHHMLVDPAAGSHDHGPGPQAIDLAASRVADPRPVGSARFPAVVFNPNDG